MIFTAIPAALRQRARQYYKVMKLTTLLIVIALVQASAKSFSQQITLHETNAPLTKVINAIKQQSGYQFLYTDNELKNEKFTVQVSNANIDETLKACFGNTQIDYKIVGKSILLKKSELVNNSKPFAELPPSIDVSGKVVDEHNLPIPGATVRVKDGIATTTDKDGNFILRSIDDKALIVVSFVGYVTQQLAAKSQLGTITLTVSESKLDEVQVIAYGTTTRRLSTGDVATVKSDIIEKQSINNPLAALQGQVAGLVVSSTNGVTGSAFKVQIRGQNSIANGSEPLFLIDGIPFAPNNQPISLLTSMANQSLDRIGTGVSPFSVIDPLTIESIDVLKDADATAIYGSKGANGVILITTKKGKAGKTTLNANVWSGVSSVANPAKLLNTQQYLTLRREAFKNDGIVPDANNAPDLTVWDTTRYTNWQKIMYGNTAHTTDAHLAVSGGNANYQFILNGGLYHTSTVFPTDVGDNRYSFNGGFTNISTDKKFSMSWSNSLSYDNNHLPYNAGGINLPPDAPALYDENGKLYWGPPGANYNNPLAFSLMSNSVQTSNLLSSLTTSYKPIPELTIRTLIGYSALFVKELFTQPINTYNPTVSFYGTGSSTFANNDFKTWSIEPQLQYQKSFKQAKIDILIGGTWQDKKNYNWQIDASGYTTDILLTSLQSAPTIDSKNSSSSDYKYAAMFGKLNFSWDDRYIINITGRRDGSSRFGPNRQFSNFGALGGTWIFSNENFFKRVSFLSFGKLRASYGVTGNDQIGDYKFLPTYSSSGVGSGYNGTTALVPGGLYNPEYSWERNRKLEGGVDIGFWNDRVLFSLSYFRNIANNQLIPNYPLPSQTGFPSVLQNSPATVINRGWEFIVNYDILRGKDYKLTAAFNFTTYSNKLESFPNLSSSPYATKYEIGKPVTIIRGFVSDGVDPTTGVYKMRDLNADGTISYDGKDFASLLTLDPKYYGGLNLNFTFKGLELAVFLDCRKQMGRNYLYGLYNDAGSAPGMMVNQLYLALNRWQKAGDQTEVQKATQDFSTPASSLATDYIYNSSAIYSDASFIKLRTLSIGYNLPKKWLSKCKISNLKFYLQGQNLFTITSLKGGIDPEMPDYSSSIPQLRTLTAGLNLSL